MSGLWHHSTSLDLLYGVIIPIVHALVLYNSTMHVIKVQYWLLASAIDSAICAISKSCYFSINSK